MKILKIENKKILEELCSNYWAFWWHFWEPIVEYFNGKYDTPVME